MTDRELLEMAARAAGLDVVYKYGSHYLGGDEWWPLDDDGDALRLAVKLSLTVHATKIAAFCELEEKIFIRVPFIGSDDGAMSSDAATRRAIVRAAAAIGEGME